MTTIQKIANKRDDLIKIAKYLGADNELANDLVQDLLLKLCERDDLSRFEYDGDLNIPYLFAVLRNAFIDVKKKPWRFVEFSQENIRNAINNSGLSSDMFIHDPERYSSYEERDRLISKSKSVISKMHFYPMELFNAYVAEPHSIRTFAEKTGISPTNIFYTIKKVREDVKNGTKKERQEYEKTKRIKKEG